MFERKPMEQMVNEMIAWARGTTSKLTDFRVGSKTRTLFEAVAIQIEKLYDRIYRSLRKLIEENIYQIVGFDKLPAKHATGIVRFSRSTASDTNYTIPANTVVMTSPTDTKAPVRFRTVNDAVLEVGKLSVDVDVVCDEAGIRGNVGANEINTFSTQPTGVETVANPSATLNGKEEETKEEQKARFNGFVQANARGHLRSIEYGATLAKRLDAKGDVLEEIRQSVAIEDLVNRKGEVDLFIWNGTGASTTTIKDTVTKIITGYYDENGNSVYGYKPAGIIVYVKDAGTKSLKLRISLTAESWTTVDALKPSVEAEVDAYFGSLKLGQSFIQSALQANINFVDGVSDAKVEVSIDGGTTYTTNNVTTTASEICLVTKPITYV